MLNILFYEVCSFCTNLRSHGGNNNFVAMTDDDWMQWFQRKASLTITISVWPDRAVRTQGSDNLQRRLIP